MPLISIDYSSRLIFASDYSLEMSHKTHLDSGIVVTARQSRVFDELPLNGMHAHAHVVLEFDVIGYSGSSGHHDNSVYDKAETIKSTLSIDLVQESNVARGNQLRNNVRRVNI